MGDIHFIESRNPEAMAAFQQTLDLYDTINSQYSIANACYEYALLFKEIPNQKEQASQLFQQTADIFAAINLPKDLEECKKYLSTD